MALSIKLVRDDPLQFSEQLGHEERALHDAAHHYRQSSLPPRITLAARHEQLDGDILTGMGSLASRAPTLPEAYGGEALSYVAYGSIAPEVERMHFRLSIRHEMHGTG